MAFAVKTFAKGQLPNAVADLYAAGAGESCYIKNLRVANMTAGPITVTLLKRSAGVDCTILKEVLAAGDILNGAGELLATGESIRGFASAAASIDYMIDGISET